MREIVVRTKQELKEAVKNKVEFIIIEGELARKVYKTKVFKKNIHKTSKWANEEKINTAGVASMAALTGIEIAIIIVAVSVGIGLIISLWKGYEIVDFEVDSQPPMAKFKVKR